MDLHHIQVVFLVLLVVKTISVQPLVPHHLNQKAHASLRLIRSATTNQSLDPSRAISVVNCYGSSCVINEEFCNETKQRCETCRYEHDVCTANWDCFHFCSEKAAQEICGGSTEIIESPWWPYLLLAILAFSVATNVYFIINKICQCKRQEPKWRKNSENGKTDKDEKCGLVSSDQGKDIAMNSPDMAPAGKTPTAPAKFEMPRELQSGVQGGFIAQATDDPV